MSFRGQIVELPIGTAGLTGTKNLSVLRPDQLLEADNVSFFFGTLHKEGGASKYNSTAITSAPSVIGGWDWIPSDGIQRMIVVTSAGDILRDTGAGTFGTTLASGLTVSSVVPFFVDCGKEAAANNRKLFIYTGKNAVQVLSGDGVTTTALSSPPADWTGTSQPSFGVLHEGRVFAGGNLNDPHRIYYPLTTNHEDYLTAGAGSIAVFPGEGERLIAGASFKGGLILFKRPFGIYFVDTSNSDVTKWRVTKISKNVGAVSPQSVVPIPDDLVFMDANANIHLLSATTEFGDVSTSNLSQAGDMSIYLQENLNLGQLQNARGIYYDGQKEVHFAVAGSGSTLVTRRIIIDYNRPDRPRFRFSTRDTCESLWLRKDSNGVPRPTSGDAAGFVWLMDQASRSKDSAGYNGQFQTAHTDLSFVDSPIPLASRRKNGKFLELVVEPQGNWNLSVDVLWDDAITQTLQFNMGTTGASLGSFVLGTDKLAGSTVLNKKKRITGSGRRISLIGRNSGDAQDFSVSKFLLHFSLGNERL